MFEYVTTISIPCFQNKSILEASYSTILFTGGLGTAMIPKVMSNMICCINLVAMGESMMIGEMLPGHWSKNVLKISLSLAKRSGLDLPTFWHAIRASAGNSFLWETAGPNIMNGDYHKDFNMDLICKDIQLSYDMAKAAKVSAWNP